MAESFQGIDGLQHGFEYRDDAVVETLSIDYSTADVEKIAELPGSDFSGNLESGKVSLKESLKAFEGGMCGSEIRFVKKQIAAW